jgi:hypothetical protein
MALSKYGDVQFVWSYNSMAQPGKGKVLTEPKTQRSRRTVHLAAGTVAALRQAQQKLERIAEGPKWTENGIVFRTQTGGMLA